MTLVSSPWNFLGRRLCILLFVTGCSTIPNIDPSNDFSRSAWQDHHLKAKEIISWQIKGKLGFKSLNQGGSASIDWLQSKEQYQISMRGPFAAGRATIKGDNLHAQMQHGKEQYSNTPQTLALQLTGLSLPVNDLAWWVKGIPSPNQAAVSDLRLTSAGTAAEFKQNGWQLSFSRYRITDQGNLPRKIIGQRGQQSFIIVISNWRFPSN